mmetsp:Transcript_32320/g.126633  ORF Transcript_32320/g.126633 Transcript_32320/m.126633 type:complete len:204 (-) Transcript_32320:2008-2619(-)
MAPRVRIQFSLFGYRTQSCSGDTMRSNFCSANLGCRVLMRNIESLNTSFRATANPADAPASRNGLVCLRSFCGCFSAAMGTQFSPPALTRSTRSFPYIRRFGSFLPFKYSTLRINRTVLSISPTGRDRESRRYFSANPRNSRQASSFSGRGRTSSKGTFFVLLRRWMPDASDRACFSAPVTAFPRESPSTTIRAKRLGAGRPL